MSQQIKVGVIISDKQKRILLLKEKKNKNSLPLWNMVKGSYGDINPETILAAAQRECQEEAGVEVKLTGLLGVYVSQEKAELRAQFTFLAKIKNGIPKLAPADEQLSRQEYITELKWFTVAEIKKMKTSEFISQRTYAMIKDWLNNKSYPLESIKQTKM